MAWSVRSRPAPCRWRWEAGVQVLPVAIHGAGKVLPPAGFIVRPGTIRVRFGTPIDTAGLHANERNALTHRARANRSLALLGQT